MIFFSRNFDYGRILVRFKEVLDAKNLWYFTLGIDGEADRSQTLELNLQESFNDVIIPYWRNLNCNFDLCSFLLSDFEPNLLEVLKSLIAPD